MGVSMDIDLDNIPEPDLPPAVQRVIERSWFIYRSTGVMPDQTVWFFS